MANPVRLVLPNHEALPTYVAALETGWSPSNVMDVSAAHLHAIRADADAFLAELAHPPATIETEPGVFKPRLPGFVRWIWDGAFSGVVNLRHQHGTLDLPPHVSGHIGYAVIPARRRRGYASQALALMLPLAAERGLERVLLTCDAGNTASRGVIERNAGRFAGEQDGKWLFWVATRR